MSAVTQATQPLVEFLNQNRSYQTGRSEKMDVGHRASCILSCDDLLVTDFTFSHD